MPVASHIRMGKMLVAHRLDVLNIDNITKGTRVNDLLDSSVVGRISQDLI